ncbi:MAG: YidC/Oxa1 family insertase periplasmic-domain containing protein [Planctomycetaceae bacterium]|jgi:YidC/Oxa1 family membrane protein insertase|nr:YidC/Oxa1 family insertase periplasmic-domain containing protein [Planctomycetaceae bacterium]
MNSLLPDQRRPFRERNTIFLILLLGLLVIQMMTVQPAKKPDLDKPLDKAKNEENKETELKPAHSAVGTETQASASIEQTNVSPQYLTLGSLNPKKPCKMLVTLTNQGAAVTRIELNHPQYRDVQEHSGYLGQIIADERQPSDAGLKVQTAGDGTPARRAGLAAGDIITELTYKDKTHQNETVPIKNTDDLRNALRKTKPKDSVDLTYIRNGNKITITVPLAQYPMDIIRPEFTAKDYEEYRLLGGLRGAAEKTQPLSFLTTLQTVDDKHLALPASQQVSNSALRGLIPADKTLEDELTDAALRNECWCVVSAAENEAVFSRSVPKWNLEFVKSYKLNENYDLTLKIEVRNLDTQEHKIAYQLDGPTGLPLEGGWYSRKTGPGWGSYGIRDVVVKFPSGEGSVISNNEINIDKIAAPWIDDTPEYIGVDSLYFQATLKPQRTAGGENWHSKIFPTRIGTKNTDWTMLTGVSYRIWSQPKVLQPNEKIEHTYTLFAGPKDTKILADYGLGNTISYGWFWFAAIPLLGVLHFFHSLGLTYAMAIIALTVGVRLIMFPLSIKQAASAIKMQQIQPELKALADKYKDDMQARAKAQSALFKRHNYHPASGCLPLLIQLPIFIGLYKALSIDAGLYGTPLISSTVRWCNDLSAPDMLFDWSTWWTSLGWTSFNMGQGMFALGPYFNLLPMLTIVLFLFQQAVMMPPPTDEQSRMQRTMMQWMMVFMGILFFKIPSGLCIYFIISTLWGLLERRFIPKAPVLAAADTVIDVTPDKQAEKQKKPPQKAMLQKQGMFAKWIHNVTEKAAENRKLHKVDKKKKRK